MTLLPVVQRELRVAARQARTYYGRMIAAAVAFVVVGYAAVYARLLGTGQGGRGLFFGLVSVTAWACLLVGISATADAISRERREGTLGFLFLSHLGGLDIVLGKLTAQAAQAWYALLAVMPILALPFLDGGVAPGEFWWMMLALTNTLFFAVSLGLFTSSLCQDSRQATHLALGGALLFWLGLPGLGTLMEWQGWPDPLRRTLLELSPLSACTVMSKSAVSPVRAWLFSHGLAWLFLLGASVLTRRAWRERPPGRGWSRWQEWRRRLDQGRPERQLERRRRLLDRSAFLWLTARHRWKPLWPLALVMTMLALLGAGWWYEGSPVPPLALATILGAALHLLLKFLIAGEAAAAITAHRREGTLELLLSTPLTPHDIIRAQFQMIGWQFALPLGLTAVLTLGIGLTAAFGDEDARAFGLVIAGLAIAALFADVVTLVWLASWQAMAARRVRHAAGGTVLRVLVLPWLVLFFGTPFFRPGSFGEVVALWAVLGFVSDFIWWQWARSRLLESFRAQAAQSPGTKS